MKRRAGAPHVGAMRMPFSMLVLVAANLVPLIGVAFWGWDIFLLLILYWLETAVIGFWTILRVLLVSGDGSATLTRMSGVGRIVGRGFQAAFFTVHAGIFMTVHFVFLWTLFAGAWAEIVHTPAQFIRIIVIETGLWLPLLILFLVRGWFLFRDVLLGEADSEGDIVAGLYIRVVLMQIAIIFGGWLAWMAGGGAATLGLLVSGKIVVDIYSARIANRVGEATRKAATERDGA